MANKITVIAWGAPGSFARNVQHDPTIAIHLKRALEAMYEEFSAQQCGAVKHAASVLELTKNWMKHTFVE